MAMSKEGLSSSSSDSDYLEDKEDHLQKELELTEPIPSVDSQAYILIVGDSQTGKSMLAWSFMRHPKPNVKRYQSIAINGLTRFTPRTRTSIGLHFFCAPFRSGDEDCFLKPPPENPPYNLIIYLFDVNRRETFRNLFTKWHPQLTDYLGGHHIIRTILVGNKSDLRPLVETRENYSFDRVSAKQAEEERWELGADEYVEVSALPCINTSELLARILRRLHIKWEPDF